MKSFPSRYTRDSFPLQPLFFLTSLLRSSLLYFGVSFILLVPLLHSLWICLPSNNNPFTLAELSFPFHDASFIFTIIPSRYPSYVFFFTAQLIPLGWEMREKRGGIMMGGGQHLENTTGLVRAEGNGAATLESGQSVLASKPWAEKYLD